MCSASGIGSDRILARVSARMVDVRGSCAACNTAGSFMCLSILPQIELKPTKPIHKVKSMMMPTNPNNGYLILIVLVSFRSCLIGTFLLCWRHRTRLAELEAGNEKDIADEVSTMSQMRKRPDSNRRSRP